MVLPFATRPSDRNLRLGPDRSMLSALGVALPPVARCCQHHAQLGLVKCVRCRISGESPLESRRRHEGVENSAGFPLPDPDCQAHALIWRVPGRLWCCLRSTLHSGALRHSETQRLRDSERHTRFRWPGWANPQQPPCFARAVGSVKSTCKPWPPLLLGSATHNRPLFLSAATLRG